MEEDYRGGACGVHGIGKKCIQNFSSNTWRKKKRNTWKS